MSRLFFDRVWAIMIRHLLLQFRDMYRLTSLLFWPFFDVVIWGFMSMWALKNGSTNFIPVVGSFFWQTTSRSSADIGSSFMDELLSKNISNLFSSPLRFIDYLFALSLISLLRVIVILILCGFTIWWLTDINMLMFGWWLVPLLLSFLISGTIMALFSCALLLRWGMRAIEFIWVIAWCTSAFIGVFYPISVLPTSMQYVSMLFPMTYAFNAVHAFTATGSMQCDQLLISFALNVVYGVVALWVLHATYKATCNKGLARLEVD